MVEQTGPIFIVGNSRSGTTLMSNILGRNCQVYSFGELHFFEQMWIPDQESHRLNRSEAVDLAAKIIGRARVGRLALESSEKFRLEAEDIIEDSTDYIDIYKRILNHETTSNGKIIPCEQTPRYIFYIDAILELFPSARILVMQRDLRDILLSQKNKWRQYRGGKTYTEKKELVRAWANYHPILLSQMWKQAMRAAEKHTDNERLLWVRFEGLVQDPEETVTKVCAFTNIEFSRDMLSVPSSKSHLAKNQSIKSGISSAPIRRWESALDIGDIYWGQRVAGDELSARGYDLDNRKVALIPKYSHVLSLPVKAFISLLLNLSQSKNLIKTIKMRFFA